MNAGPLLDRLPIIIGVTGHRDLDLRPGYETILRERVAAIFARLERDFPSTPLLLLTPLAEGADQLVAEVARSRGIPYRVPMPMPLERYREDFTTGASRAAFDALVEGAATPPYAIRPRAAESADDDPDRRSECYARVGAHIVRSSHVLIALWNGLPADTVGGTAHIVRFRVLGIPQPYARTESIIDEPEVGPVHHIYAARTSEPRTLEPVGTYSLRVPAGAKHRTGGFDSIEERPGDSPDPFELLYARLEAFNRDCAILPVLPAPPEQAAATSRLMLIAERLATHFQRRSRTALTRLFIATALAALMFQLYANLVPDAHVMVIPYVLALGIAGATYLRADRGRWQDRAQDYRALELGLSVQRVWDAVGLRESVADYYIARQRTELDWIPKAIRAAHVLDLRLPFDEERGIAHVREFVTGQHAYFAGSGGRAGAAAREEAQSARFEFLRRWAVRAGFIASAFLIVFAVAASLAPEVFGDRDRTEFVHSCILFCIGSTAIAAALFNDYLERRGFEEHARRYELMAALYGRALAALDDPSRPPLDVARSVIAKVGHEALAENGDWVLMHRALPIEILQVS